MNEMFIFFQIRGFSKSIFFKKTEAVFTKAEMSYEWNVNFLQNKNLCSKGIETEAVFIKAEMSYEWNVNFLRKTNLCSKGIETEAVFIKAEMSYEWNVNFLRKTNLYVRYFPTGTSAPTAPQNTKTL